MIVRFEKVTPNEFYYAHTKEEIEAIAFAAGTSFGNFKQIAIAKGNVSKVLAEKLCLASAGLMTELEILYPERYKKDNDYSVKNEAA